MTTKITNMNDHHNYHHEFAFSLHLLQFRYFTIAPLPLCLSTISGAWDFPLSFVWHLLSRGDLSPTKMFPIFSFLSSFLFYELLLSLFLLSLSLPSFPPHFILQCQGWPQRSHILCCCRCGEYLQQVFLDLNVLD